MAELATLPSSAKLQIPTNFFHLHHIIPPNVSLKTLKSGSKKYCYGNVKVQASSRDISDFTVDTATFLGRSLHLKESSMRYCCFGTLINPDNTTTFTWVPVFDQVLMMVSIGLAYIGGVVPADKAGFNSRKMLDHGTATPRSSSGSAVKNDPQGDVQYAWVEVERKLLSALDAVQQDGGLDGGVVESQKYVAKCPLSLSAIAEGPRLRLLWATLQQLEKEVNTCPGDRQVVDRRDWMATSLNIIQQSCQSVFLTWLEEELRLENKKDDKDILLTMIEQLKQDDNISKNIRKSGKEDLYADLLFFLRFHFLGIDCCYDSKLLGQHAIDVLEDLVITLADGITTSYLELISVDSNITSEMNYLGLNLCSLSTRALQKLRNEMALKQFLHQNMDSVVSMYEDRFDLYSFQVQLAKETDKNKQDKLHWWKQLVVNKATSTVSSLQHMVISPLSLSVKRTRELRALSGWRYYFSLFLEFSDITMPLVKVLFTKVSSAVSFLLVTLVGRSLGLIYSGIRQSLGWSNPTPTMMKPLSLSSSSIQMPARRLQLQLHDQTFDTHPSSSSSSSSSKATKKKKKKSRRQFEASAHEVPSGPNPISNRKVGLLHHCHHLHQCPSLPPE